MTSKRRRARELAIQMLFQSDIGRTPPEMILADFRPLDYVNETTDSAPRSTAGQVPKGRLPEREVTELGEALEYARTLVRGTLSHLDEIDELIRKQAEHWRLERMPTVDRNILRLATYEFLYETDVPKLVILDEAIELAKEFGTEQSGRFVNGVLDGILKSHSLPGTLT
jgi:N utilization substance protein B